MHLNLLSRLPPQPLSARRSPCPASLSLQPLLPLLVCPPWPLHLSPVHIYISQPCLSLLPPSCPSPPAWPIAGVSEVTLRFPPPSPRPGFATGLFSLPPPPLSCPSSPSPCAYIYIFALLHCCPNLLTPSTCVVTNGRPPVQATTYPVPPKPWPLPLSPSPLLPSAIYIYRDCPIELLSISSTLIDPPPQLPTCPSPTPFFGGTVQSRRSSVGSSHPMVHPLQLPQSIFDTYMMIVAPSSSHCHTLLLLPHPGSSKAPTGAVSVCGVCVGWHTPVFSPWSFNCSSGAPPTAGTSMMSALSCAIGVFPSFAASAIAARN